MTPEERAKELVSKYKAIEWKDSLCIGDAGWERFDLEIPHNEAKKCALIVVDEILSIENWNREYWQQVKIEIEYL